ncbi:MAG: leucyl aminopeptidase family protein, partial [Myxococcales bacterium]|nr:leucyl aminopeptidase family protein [Myxococcales bacterium]
MPIRLVDAVSALAAPTILFFGRRAVLLEAAVRQQLPPALASVYDAMLDSAGHGGDRGVAASTWLPGDPKARHAVIGVLPDAGSRHNAPARPDAVTSFVAHAIPREGTFGIVSVLESAEHVFATALAIARALPLYQGRSKPRPAFDVHVAFITRDGTRVSAPYLDVAMAAVREAARLADMPTSELDTARFIDVARSTVESLPGTSMRVIEGEALAAEGLGGLHAVGRAAVAPPALVHLIWNGDPSSDASPARDVTTWAWVGKGIVYDTGGLSLKTKTGMPGMKGDMAGAAAVLCAFEAAVRAGTRHRIHALLCLAENAVGPNALRPDDIITLYSGRTVEVNNTDAEGRLVLGDGVAWAARNLNPSIIVDMATLTGAQLVATGRRHAAVITNDETWEHATVIAGRHSGDLVHPLPYCPEFFRSEFKSD